MEIVIWYPKSTFDLHKDCTPHMHTDCTPHVHTRIFIYVCITYKINTKAKDMAQW